MEVKHTGNPLEVSNLQDLSGADFCFGRSFLKNASLALTAISLAASLTGCVRPEEKISELPKVTGKEVLANASQYLGQDVVLVCNNFSITDTNTGPVKVGVPGYKFGPYYSFSAGKMKFGYHYSSRASTREEIRTLGWTYTNDQDLPVYKSSSSTVLKLNRELINMPSIEPSNWILRGTIKSYENSGKPYLELRQYATPTGS